ncbi:uncharacterized protein LOC128307504 [Anopheles moucheti]|uniref:uncharacterized protein LOC128307504 n=1 Tax=Anopheles moucheti TaxID=186751 RepID=UPI0022F087EF|nr:uncharacterized protein LOC128307504 [Anopheles moucheti]
MEKVENATSRITKEQIERLVQIMEKNPDAAKGICTNPTAFWGEVSLELNSLGPSKDSHSWKKTWTDKKSNVKKKFSLMRSEQKKTGGGIPLAIRLNNIEERILNVTNIKANVEGAKDTICVGIPECSSDQQEKTIADPCGISRQAEPAYAIDRLDQEATASKATTSSIRL